MYEADRQITPRGEARMRPGGVLEGFGAEVRPSVAYPELLVRFMSRGLEPPKPFGSKHL